MALTEQEWLAFQKDHVMRGFYEPSALAELISSDRYAGFTPEQKGEVFARLIAEEKVDVVFGSPLAIAESPRSAPMAPWAGETRFGDQVDRDQALIAQELDAAFREKKVSVADLTSLSEGYPLMDERVVGLLSQYPSGPGGAAEAYALAMLDKYPLGATPATDPAALDAQGMALSMLANDPALREAHFGGASPGLDPRAAFETLVAYNDQHPYRAEDPLLTADQAANGVTAASHLYVEHVDTLLPHYTGLSPVPGSDPPQYTHNKDADSGTLAKFFEQTVTSEDARNLPMGPANAAVPGPSVIESVGQATATYAREQLDGIADIDPSHPLYRNNVETVISGLGTLQGALLVSSDLALEKAKEAGENHEDAMRNIGAGANWLISKIPLPGSGYVASAVDAGIQGIDPNIPVPTTGDPKVLSDAIYGELGTLQSDLLNDPKRQEDNSTYFNWQDYFEEEVSEGRATVESDLGTDRPSERHFDMSTGDTSQHSSLTTPTVGATDVASLTSPDHPDSARYAASLRGCEGCRLPLDATELANVASTVALRSREAGLPSVDHVVASPGGDRVFAVAGRLDDPAHLRISVPVAEARERSVDTNSREWAELERTRTAEIAPEVELAQRSAMRMA